MGSLLTYIGLILISSILGLVAFYILLSLIPFLERKENLSQKKELLNEAQKQRKVLLKKYEERTGETIKLLEEELEEDLIQNEQDTNIAELELDKREEFAEREEERVSQKESQSLKTQEEIETKALDTQEKKLQWQETVQQAQKKLSATAKLSIEEVTEKIVNSYVDDKKLELQKTQRFLAEELNSSARKNAKRMLDSALCHYQPEFYWPKSTNLIEINDEKTIHELNQPNINLLEPLEEYTGVSIKFNPSEDSPSKGIIRFGGGFGVSKESARLTLNEAIKTPNIKWKKLQALYDKNFRNLEQEAVLLGKKAVEQLKLSDIHPEIQKLVGSLNWRTSYRQNQWYHTVEVATLAGILAVEMGVDENDAKRAGLLHDIGKAIDYRIDGSHAVISCDYADRFGEKRYICDAVLSHHSDLIVEHPLSYVLCAADTLSGGRPGARVNLEEGYQIRLGAIYDCINSFKGISDVAIMNGGREVHIQVHYRQVKEKDLKDLAQSIVKKIEENVAYPGQIKIVLSRKFESTAVA